jgi:preprotein translocase subunit SecY
VAKVGIVVFLLFVVDILVGGALIAAGIVCAQYISKRTIGGAIATFIVAFVCAGHHSESNHHTALLPLAVIILGGLLVLLAVFSLVSMIFEGDE